ncbi:MAG: MoaD/ThiS family protein [Candidatus Odinarchaeota archaeon]
MDAEIDITHRAFNAGIAEIQLTEAKTVRELLRELGLLHRHFVVLVDGRRALLDEEIAEDQRVIVLPIIAGG